MAVRELGRPQGNPLALRQIPIGLQIKNISFAAYNADTIGSEFIAEFPGFNINKTIFTVSRAIYSSSTVSASKITGISDAGIHFSASGVTEYAGHRDEIRINAIEFEGKCNTGHYVADYSASTESVTAVHAYKNKDSAFYVFGSISWHSLESYPDVHRANIFSFFHSGFSGTNAVLYGQRSYIYTPTTYSNLNEGQVFFSVLEVLP